MELAQLNPYIRYAREHKWLQRKQNNSRCYDCRLFFIHTGSGELVADGEKYAFSAGTVMFLPPGTVYRITQGQDCPSVSILVFNFDLVDDYAYLNDSLGTADESQFDESRCPRYGLPEEFAQVIVQSHPNLFKPLYECVDRCLTKPPYYRERCSAQLKLCLLELLHAYGTDSSTKIIESIMDYIQHHYENPQLSNGELSRAFGYNRNYLSQLFREKMGSPLHHYLLQYRIRVAKNYLITTNLDVSTVAWKCGFNSCAYFIKQFKKDVGVTPREFRKNQMKQIF